MEKVFKINNMFTYEESQNSYEPISDKPSLVIPDLSLTIRELVERFIRGQDIAIRASLPQEFDHVSGEELELHDITKLDKIERIQLAREIDAKIENTQMELKELRKRKNVAKALKDAVRQKEDSEKDKEDSEKDS